MLKKLKENIISKYFLFGILFIVTTSLITLVLCNNLFDEYKAGNLSGAAMYYDTVFQSNIFLINLAPFAAILSAYQIIFAKNRVFVLKDFFASGIVGGLVFPVAQVVLLVGYLLIAQGAWADFEQLRPLANGEALPLGIGIGWAVVNSFVLGFVYAQLSFSIAQGSRKKNEAVVLPIVIYLIGMYCQSYAGHLYAWLPLGNYLPFSGKSLSEHWFGLLIIIPISILILLFKNVWMKRALRENKSMEIMR